MIDDNSPADLSEPSIPQAAGLRELKGSAESSPAGGAHVNLDMIMDVNVSVSVEVGRARMSINDLLKLSQGAIIELDRMAGEPLDVLVNGTLVARGEIVVVRDKFGIMLTEVVSPEERLRRLR